VSLPYAEQVGRSPTEGSLLMAATLAGTAVGSAFVARAGPQRQLDVILPMAAASSLTLVVVALTPSLPVAILLWFVSGAFAGFLVPLIGSVALFTGNTRRGRVMGLAAAGYNLLVACVYLLGGWLADLTSPAATVAGAGVVGLLLVGVSRAIWPAAAMRREVERAYAPAASPDPVD